MVLVIQDLEIIVTVVKDRFGPTADIEGGQWVRLAAQLQASLFQVVEIQVNIPTCPNKFAYLQLALLGD